MCGVAHVGYTPVIVQHAMWDYGMARSAQRGRPEGQGRHKKRGKGHLNTRNFFGAAVASLYRMLDRHKFGFPTTQVADMQERHAFLLTAEE
jgi:hypothetical protein